MNPRVKTPFPESVRKAIERLGLELAFETRFDEGESTFPRAAFDANGRVQVDPLLTKLGRSRNSDRPLVAITTRDLAKEGCGSLFGYADPLHKTCVVSVARLGTSSENIERRLPNLIRHELGHLDGLSHCRSEGCLMHPVSEPDALELRSDSPCSRCLRQVGSPSVWMRRAAALVFLVAVVILMNATSTVFDHPPHQPFSRDSGASGEPPSLDRLAFNGVPFQTAVLHDDADAVVSELNALFQMLEPPKVSVKPMAADRAVIVSGQRELMEIHDSDALGEARLLAERLNNLLEYKGTAASSCVDCHRDRQPEVIAASARRLEDLWPGPF